MDIAAITAAISAATGAVGLIDKIADQVERFLTRKPQPAVPKEHRMMIERKDSAIVVQSHGQTIQKITANDLQKLPESHVRHIKVLEQSMENHYAVWEAVYPQLALETNPISKARLEQQLKGIIRDMKGDLNAILDFLTQCGVILDDHYLHIRDLVNQV